MNPREIRKVIQEELKRRELNPFSATKKTGLPANALRYVLEGRQPRIGRMAEICRALGLEFYIGPKHETVTTDLDRERLVLAIEYSEQALKQNNRKMNPKQKAELVIALYDLFKDSSNYNKEQLIKLISVA